MLAPDGVAVFDVPTPGFIGHLATGRSIDDADDEVVRWPGESWPDDDRIVDLVIDVSPRSTT